MKGDKSDNQAQKIIAESRRLNNILELQNSNAIVRPVLSAIFSNAMTSDISRS